MCGSLEAYARRWCVHARQPLPDSQPVQLVGRRGLRRIGLAPFDASGGRKDERTKRWRGDGIHRASALEALSIIIAGAPGAGRRRRGCCCRCRCLALAVANTVSAATSPLATAASSTVPSSTLPSTASSSSTPIAVAVAASATASTRSLAATLSAPAASHQPCPRAAPPYVPTSQLWSPRDGRRATASIGWLGERRCALASVPFHERPCLRTLRRPHVVLSGPRASARAQ